MPPLPPQITSLVRGMNKSKGCGSGAKRATKYIKNAQNCHNLRVRPITLSPPAEREMNFW